MTDLKIHPAAECVRLMDAEELASLAASIEASGLRDPIILGRVNGAETDIMLVDGRNRLRACEIAGVEPHFETLNFEDDEAVKAYVADKSEHRNLTKGQQAMRLALLYPEPEKGGRGHKGKALETSGFSRQRLGQARAVLAYSRDLAIAVREGTRKLDEALDEAKAARAALETAESKLTRLRDEAPDLADFVDEGMSIDEACAAFEQRKRDAEKKVREEQEARQRHTLRVYEIVSQLYPRHGVEAWLEYFARDLDRNEWPSPGLQPLNAEILHTCADALHALAATLEERHE
jgi:ParB-like chromosome segregation protein Spo0J